MKIRTQILATLGAVAVLPAISLVGLAHRETAREIGDGMHRNLRAAAERTAAQVDGFILACLEEVRSLATLPAMQEALVARTRSPQVLEQVNQILTILEARDPVNSIAFGLVDANGVVLVDAEPAMNGLDEHDRVYFHQTGRTHLPWANHEPWGDSGDRVLVVASPVRNPLGEPIGRLRLVLENATLQQILSAAVSPADDHDLALFDQDDRLVADALWPTQRHRAVLAPDSTDAIANAGGPVAWIGPDGITHGPGLASFATLAHARWRLMAWQPTSSFDAAVAGLCRQRLQGLGLLISLLIAAAWLASRWIARPIQRLEQAATAIANGNLEAPIPTGSGEVGTLGATMQTMQQRLLTTMAEVQRAARDAECASTAKSQFLANMSHELRTPLTAILGFAELLAAEDKGPAEHSHAATIHRNARHLLGLVNEVLDLAKVESGTMEVTLEDFSPIDLVRGVVDLLHVQARDKGIALRCRIGDVPVSMRSDPHRLKQILINLVGNALKFTDSGAVEICIGVAGQPAILVCEVTDTGPGINPDKLEALFEPFSQVDATMTRRHGGTGLGLAISRRLARKLGGDLVAHSKVGEGSTFVLTVPADERPQTRVPAPETPVGTTQLRGRILIVEDGADNRRLLQHILQRAGAEVTLAEDGLQGVCALSEAGDPALGLATPLPFDLVLMDMQMPVLDGLSATRQLRAMGLHVPIIALTAHAMDEARDQCIQAGCDEWATKPINRRTLLDLCATWLRHSQRAVDAHACLDR